MKTAIELIAEERERQINAEGYTAQRDDNYEHQELALAAASYALPSPCRQFAPASMMGRTPVPDTWPWGEEWWKPNHTDRVRELVKAGALIAAEIDRLQRRQNNKTCNGGNAGQ